jgi:hypothetical protein
MIRDLLNPRECRQSILSSRVRVRGGILGSEEVNDEEGQTFQVKYTSGVRLTGEGSSRHLKFCSS